MYAQLVRVLVVAMLFCVVVADPRPGLAIDTADQDVQNLLAMLKRNGFTEERELQEALKVLRPEKFKGNTNIGDSRTKRQAIEPVPAATNGEASSALAAPPVDATHINLAPIAPQLPASEHQLDGIIAPHGVDGALNKVIGESSADSLSAPSSSSSSSISSGTNEEDAKDGKSSGILSGVVHRVKSLFSSSD